MPNSRLYHHSSQPSAGTKLGLSRAFLLSKTIFQQYKQQGGHPKTSSKHLLIGFGVPAVVPSKYFVTTVDPMMDTPEDLSSISISSCNGRMEKTYLVP